MPALRNPPRKGSAKTGTGVIRMSEAEFIEWSGDELRAEWVDGQVEIMNAVVLNHARLTVFLIVLVANFVAGNELGEVFNEPYQVRLPRQRRRRSPDLFFVSSSRMNLVEEHQCNGPPDLIVEVISSDSQNRDRRVKFLEYQSAGVQEYWLADPINRSFEAYSLSSGGVYEAIPLIDGKMNSLVLKGFYFRQEWVWQLHFPNPVAVIQQMIRDMKKRPSTRKPKKSDNQS